MVNYYFFWYQPGGINLYFYVSNRYKGCIKEQRNSREKLVNNINASANKLINGSSCCFAIAQLNLKLLPIENVNSSCQTNWACSNNKCELHNKMNFSFIMRDTSTTHIWFSFLAKKIGIGAKHKSELLEYIEVNCWDTILVSVPLSVFFILYMNVERALASHDTTTWAVQRSCGAGLVVDGA
jgi:hypothetical protein